MRILHVASFTGNIGDNASHLGLYKLLNSFHLDYEVEQLEIRKFYRKYEGHDRQYFDVDFIEYANTFDLLIIGGGGFLDYWIEGSVTGTTIDMSPELVRKITVPTLIASVGCMPHHTVPVGNVEKYRRFLDAILQNENIKLLIRNDGSVNSFADDIGKHYLEDISEILDNGFFYESDSIDHLPFSKPYVAVNITTDQLSMHSKSRNEIAVDLYYAELAKVVTYIVNNMKMDVVLVPHIHADLKAISRLFEDLDDFLIRTAISVAPSIRGVTGANHIFGIYRGSQFVIATRYHANVCNLAMGKPTYGLGVLDRVKYLYDEFDMQERYVDIQGAFSSICIEKIVDYQRKVGSTQLEKMKIKSRDIYAEFLLKHGLT